MIHVATRRAVRRRGRRRACSTSCPAARRRRAAGSGWSFPEALPELAGAACATLLGRRTTCSTCRSRRRGGQDRRGRRPVLGGARRGRLHPQRRGRDVGGGATTDLGGFVAATWLRGVRVVARADHAARHGRRGGRRQDRHQHRARARTSSAPSTSRPACCATWPARDPARRRAASRPRRGRQVRLHRRPGDPRPRRGGPEACSTGAPRAARARRARDPGQGRRSSPGTSRRPAAAPGTRAARCSTTATPWRTPSRRRALHAAPRRGGRDRHGVRRRAGPAAGRPGRRDRRPAPRGPRARWACPTGWDGASYDDLRARMAVDKKSRGSLLRFVVLDGLGEPGDPGRARARTSCARRTT